jgi:hypothetical protein
LVLQYPLLFLLAMASWLCFGLSHGLLVSPGFFGWESGDIAGWLAFVFAGACVFCARMETQQVDEGAWICYPSSSA